jgi:hypothetical protein
MNSLKCSRGTISKTVAGTIVAMCCSLQVNAAEVWHTSTIKWVYPQSTGDLVLVFDASSSNCPASGPDKYMQLYVGSNGVTLEGRKAMYAAALLAFTTGALVDVAFDNATTNCFINRLLIRNN